MKHSGEFLYKISNEEDINRFKLSKVRMPHELKDSRLRLEASPISQTTKQKESKLTTAQSSYAPTSRLGRTNEIAPVSAYLTERDNYLLPIQSKGEKHPLTGLKDQTTLYEAEDDEQIIEFEVFKNYVSLIVEKHGQRQLKSISLKTGKVHSHYFDTVDEVCPVNGEVSEFLEATFSDNLTFDSNYVQYRLTTPSTPCRTLDFFMSTKKTSGILSEDHIANFKKDNLLCEKVEMQMRDGASIPVVMVYDRRFYTEESPWVLFTGGIDS